MSTAKIEVEKMTVVEELRYLSELHGDQFTPEIILEYAKNPDTALHDRFVWDDGEAGYRYRLQQAQQIIRVTVIKQEKEEKTIEVRAYWNLPSDRGTSVYRPIEVVMENPDMNAELLDMAKGELRAFRNKYKNLVTLSKIFDEIDKL